MEVALEIANGYHAEAARVVRDRVTEFVPIAIRQLDAAGVLDAFRDPGFNNDVAKAESAAAASGTADDYEIIADLLTERAKTVADRIAAVEVSDAIAIAGRIDPNALRALTVVLALNVVHSSITTEQILDTMENDFKVLVGSGLPKGRAWIDHLDAVGAVRQQSGTTFNSATAIWTSNMAGIYAPGMRRGEEEMRLYNETCREIRCALPLVAHSYRPGYVRVSVSNLDVFRSDRLEDGFDEEEISKAIDAAITFGGVGTIEAESQRRFIADLNSREILGEVASWLQDLPTYFEATPAGRTIGRANLRRLTGVPWKPPGPLA
nr:LPO_1073/Vpar_1526 family protein [Rathayibacter sp. VKM Ac-2801]